MDLFTVDTAGETELLNQSPKFAELNIEYYKDMKVEAQTDEEANNIDYGGPSNRKYYGNMKMDTQTDEESDNIDYGG